MNTNRSNLRGGGTLLLLALIAGIMAIMVAGPESAPIALGQAGVSVTFSPTDDWPFDSPIITPTPRPTPYPILPITDPTVAYVLWLRNSFFEARFGAPPTETPPWPPTPTATVAATPFTWQFFMHERTPLPTKNGSPRAIRSHFSEQLLMRRGGATGYENRAGSVGRPARATREFSGQIAGNSTTYRYRFPVAGRFQNYQWKAVGDAAPVMSDLTALDTAWWHNWGHVRKTPGPPLAEFEDPYFVPMVWCGQEGSAGSWDVAELQLRAQTYPGRVWLIFNEPDQPPVRSVNATPPVIGYNACALQFCQMVEDSVPNASCTWGVTTPTPTGLSDLERAMGEQAALQYAWIYTTIKQVDPRARLFCCGQFYTQDGSTEWWDAFLAELASQTEYPGATLDGVHIHTYGWSGSTGECGRDQPFEQWWDCIQGKLEAYWTNVHQAGDLTRGKPLWITEYGYLGGIFRPTPTPTASGEEVRNNLMRPLVGWFASAENPGYEAVAWFTTYWELGPTDTPRHAMTFLLEAASTPTPLSTLTIPLGQEWAGYDPHLAPTATPTP